MSFPTRWCLAPCLGLAQQAVRVDVGDIIQALDHAVDGGAQGLWIKRCCGIRAGVVVANCRLIVSMCFEVPQFCFFVWGGESRAADRRQAKRTVPNANVVAVAHIAWGNTNWLCKTMQDREGPMGDTSWEVDLHRTTLRQMGHLLGGGHGDEILEHHSKITPRHTGRETGGRESSGGGGAGPVP